MILGLTVALTVLVLVVNLIADVLMAIIDPRLREERAVSGRHAVACSGALLRNRTALRRRRRSSSASSRTACSSRSSRPTTPLDADFTSEPTAAERRALARHGSVRARHLHPTRGRAAGSTLLIAAGALAVILVLGVTYGAVSGLAGGRVDNAMMRLLDGLLAIPRLPGQHRRSSWSIGLQAQNVQTVILALSIVNWMITARLVRGEVVLLKRQDYVRSRAGPRRRPPRRRRGATSCPTRSGSSSWRVFLELPGGRAGGGVPEPSSAWARRRRPRPGGTWRSRGSPLAGSGSSSSPAWRSRSSRSGPTSSPTASATRSTRAAGAQRRPRAGGGGRPGRWRRRSSRIARRARGVGWDPPRFGSRRPGAPG